MDYRREFEPNQFIEKIKGFFGMSDKETGNMLSSEDEFRLYLGIYLFLNVIMYFIMPLGIFVFWISFNFFLYLLKVYLTRGRTNTMDQYGYRAQGYGASTFFENQYNYGGLEGRIKTQPTVEKKQPVQAKVQETYQLREVRRREKKSIYSRKIGFDDDSSESEDERIEQSTAQFDRDYENPNYNALQKLILNVCASLAAAKKKIGFGKVKENQKKKKAETKESGKMEIEEIGSQILNEKPREWQRNPQEQSISEKNHIKQPMEEGIRRRETMQQQQSVTEEMTTSSLVENKESIVKSGTRNVFISRKENKKEGLWTKIKKAFKFGASKDEKYEAKSEKREPSFEKNMESSTTTTTNLPASTEETSASQVSALQSQLEMALSSILLKDAPGLDGKAQQALLFQNKTKEEVIKLLVKSLEGNQKQVVKNPESREQGETPQDSAEEKQAYVQIQREEIVEESLEKDSIEDIVKNIGPSQKELNDLEKASLLELEEPLQLNFTKIGAKPLSTFKKKGLGSITPKDSKKEPQKLVQDQSKLIQPAKLSGNVKAEPTIIRNPTLEKKRDTSLPKQQQTSLIGKPMLKKKVSEDQGDKLFNETPFSSSERKQESFSPENEQPARRIQLDEYENMNPNSKKEIQKESLFPSSNEVEEEKPKASSLETGWRFGNNERYFQAKAERKSSQNTMVEPFLAEERKIVLNEDSKLEEPQQEKLVEPKPEKLAPAFGWSLLQKKTEVEEKSKPPVFSGTSWSLRGNNNKATNDEAPKQPVIQKISHHPKQEEEQKREVERFEKEEIEYKPDDYPLEESVTYSRRIDPALIDLPPQVPEDVFSGGDTPTFLNSRQTMDESIISWNRGPQKPDTNFMQGIFAATSLFANQTIIPPAIVQTERQISFNPIQNQGHPDYSFQNANQHERQYEHEREISDGDPSMRSMIQENVDADQSMIRENFDPPSRGNIEGRRGFMIPRV